MYYAQSDLSRSSLQYIERHTFAKLLWTWFLRKMFSEVSSERVQILIICDFLRHLLEVLFHYFLRFFWVISDVKVKLTFTRYLVNNTISTTFTSVCTPTFYFDSCVIVAFSIEKILRF